MRFAIGGVMVALLAGSTVLIGSSATGIAQSSEELLMRYRAECRERYSHLLGRGQPEQVKAHVRPCIAAKMRAHVLAQLQALWERVDKQIDSGNLKEAEATARRAIARAGEFASAPGVAHGHALLGKVQNYQGRFREAEQSGRRALPAIEKASGSNSQNAAKVYNLIGFAVMNQGRQSEADTYYTRALAVQERDPGPNHPDTAFTLRNLAWLRMEQGRLSDAERLALRAVGIHEKVFGPQRADLARSLLTAATILYYGGQNAASEAYLRRAMAIGEAAFGAQHWEMATVLLQVGTNHAAAGRSAEAEAALGRAFEILKRTVGSEHRYTFTTMRVLASVKISTGDAHQAELILRPAIASAEKALGSAHAELVFLYGLLAQALSMQERLNEAEAAAKHGLAVAERIGKDSPFLGRSLSQLGSLYVRAGRLAEARAALERAHAVLDKSLGHQHAYAIEALRALAQLELAANQPGQALSKLRQAAAALDARTDGRLLRDSRYRNEIVPLTRGIALDLAQAAWQLGSAEMSTDKYAEDALLGVQLMTQSMAAAAVTQMATRFAANDDALGRLVRQDQDLLQRWEAADRQLTTGFADGSSDANSRRALRAELDRINKELSEVGRRLAAEFPEYTALARPAALKIGDIQELLRSDEAVLAFLLEDAQGFAWAITKAKSTWVKLAQTPGAFAEKIARLRCGLDDALWNNSDSSDRCVELVKAHRHDGVGFANALPFDLERAHELYKALLGPVEDLIKDKQLLIMPSGPLTSLPFNVLVTEPPKTRVPNNPAEYRDAAWLGTRQPITVLPSLTSLKALRAHAKASRANKAYLGVGNPLLDGPGEEYRKQAEAARQWQHCSTAPVQWQVVASARGRRAVPGLKSLFRGAQADIAYVRQQTPLPETADELCRIARGLGVPESEILLGSQATETSVKDLSEKGRLADYRVVHFATHGALAGELKGLSEPGLILTPPPSGTSDAKLLERDDGYLTASEIATLKLDADWVILSACNTAGAAGETAEALSGLARAFFYAGARTLLVSHWAVGSDAAVKLTTRAFDELRANPAMGRAEAFRMSMRELIRNGSSIEAHPMQWAAFVVVGEGASNR